MYPRVLIVGTVPYNRKSTSRAFASYFSGWDKDCLAQLFSNTKTPAKGHCGELFQITDQRLVQKRFKPSIQTGRLFRYADLPEQWTDDSQELNSSFFHRLYSFGAHKTPLKFLVRKAVWKKKLWCTEELLQWLDRFAPECIFLSFSDDFFIPEIALFVARRYHIPIVSSIGDDYYFNGHFSLSPFYYLYRSMYKRLIRSVFAHGGSAIYISDKIRDRYNDVFDLKGETVYLNSEISRRPFREIDPENLKVSYFGNIRQGRCQSLCDVADALAQISERYHVDVYSNQKSEKEVNVLTHNPHISFHGSIPYQEVCEQTARSDILLIVEGFRKRHTRNTRYSLSTKAADSLSSGAQILAYGSGECGVIEYMKKVGCAVVCTDRGELSPSIRALLQDPGRQRANYDKAAEISARNHTLAQSTKQFKRIVEETIEAYG